VLKAAGWGVVDGSRIRREYQIAPGRLEGFGRRARLLKADYILEYRNTKLTPLLRLKYGAIQDAIADLGQPEEISGVFSGFQQYLYSVA
jgi:hypothetical protein